MAHHLLRHPRVGVAVLTERPEVVSAAPAFSTCDRERHHDAISDLELLHVPADFHDFAHELVAKDVAVLHGGHESVEQVQIGSANGGRADAHDRIGLIENLGIGHRLDLDVLRAFPAVRSHCLASSSACLGGRAGCGPETTLASDFTTSPSSINCLKRRRSMLSWVFGIVDRMFATLAPIGPPLGLKSASS